MEIALKNMSNGKSPGIDGLTTEFLKFFWQDIKDLMINAFNDCIREGCLTPSMKTGLITLLPKPNKDSSKLDNWRPITLLCNDYKLLALVYANRIKMVLDKVVNSFQSAFIKGRNIHNNVRLILDMLDYQSMIETESLILFIDYFKAFDSVEHNFLFQTLEHFGFGKKFCSIIKMFYTEIYSYITVNSELTPRINVTCGIRQGCPISPKIFILCTQLLAYLILNNPNFQGIKVFDFEFRLSQFADDTVFFLKDKNMVMEALQIISIFSKASGLQLNLQKCELLPLFSCLEKEMFSIPVKHEVKYLGIKLIRDEKEREEINIMEKLNQMQKSFNHWLIRDLTIFGRNLLSKSEGISKLIYPCQSLYINPKNVKKINSVIFKFIWRNKTHYIRKSQLIKEYNLGGIKTTDFESMIGTFRIKWLKDFMANPDSIWFHIPKNIFNKVGGLDFLLRCDFEISKLPIKISEFHKQVLFHWKMIFSQNVTPHCATLWNNRVITTNRKTIFHQNWFDHKILFVRDILDSNGEILQLRDFKSKYDIECTTKEFQKTCRAIPIALIHLIKNTILSSYVQIKLPNLVIGEIKLNEKKCDNKYLNKSFKGKLYHDFNRKVKYKITETPVTSGAQLWKFIKWLVAPKIKEMQFKLINNYNPSAETL
uniref:Reverse transcriptase domain-containing protein n=1 Tax=Oryzias latipes TaxID=8090 RepID=A0A3P9IPY3_ORYLA